MTQIKTAIEQLAGTHRKDAVQMFDAEIVSVNESKRTCEVTMIGGESANTITARLMASVDDGSFLIPSVGSTVVVVSSDHVQPFVSMFSEVERIVWLGGEYDGVPIVTHPTNPNKGILKKLNTIEDTLKTHLNLYNAHTHTTPSGASGVPVVPDTTVVTNTTQSDIEHPNIAH